MSARAKSVLAPTPRSGHLTTVPRYPWFAHARVAELVDALDLGSSVFGRGGSSPPLRTAVVYASQTAFLPIGQTAGSAIESRRIAQIVTDCHERLESVREASPPVTRRIGPVLSRRCGWQTPPGPMCVAKRRKRIGPRKLHKWFGRRVDRSGMAAGGGLACAPRRLAVLSWLLGQCPARAVIGQAQLDQPAQVERGGSVAQCLRAIAANDQRPLTLHTEARQTDPELLPDSINELLDRDDQRRATRGEAWRHHSAAARNFHAACERMTAAAEHTADRSRGIDFDGVEL